MRQCFTLVKTLAIRSTAEENMMARREALKGRDGRLPKLTEEVGMRHYIAVSLFIADKVSMKHDIGMTVRTRGLLTTSRRFSPRWMSR